MLAVRMTILGTRELDLALDNVLRVVYDWRPLWPKLIKLFHNVESSQFSEEGSAGRSGAWPQLTPRYAAWKQKHWPGRKILQRTGTLRRSLATLNAPGSIEDASSSFCLVLGTFVPYAIYHQQGTKYMQARPPVSLTADANRKFGKEFQKFINTDALKGFDGVQRRLPFGVQV